MAIQNRRGAYEDFEPSKLLAGEWATVLSGDPNASDGKATYISFGSGNVKRMATYEDMKDDIRNATQDIADDFTLDLTVAISDAETATENAVTAVTNASAAATAASNAASSANSAAEAANTAADRLSPMTGATSSADGIAGIVPQPLAGDQDKVLKGDGTWTDLIVPATESSLGAVQIGDGLDITSAGVLSVIKNKPKYTTIVGGTTISTTEKTLTMSAPTTDFDLILAQLYTSGTQPYRKVIWLPNTSYTVNNIDAYMTEIFRYSADNSAYVYFKINNTNKQVKVKQSSTASMYFSMLGVTLNPS